jgi:hypothetical protein
LAEGGEVEPIRKHTTEGGHRDDGRGQAYYPELGGCQNLCPAGNGAHYPVDSAGQPARPVTPPVRPITEVPRHATELPGPVKKPTAYLPLDNSGNPVCPAGKAYYPHLKGCYPLYPVG